MLNQDLFNDKKDGEIARLKMAIEKFKKYDEERKQYYAEKMQRLEELEKIANQPKENDLEEVIRRQKKQITELNRVIQIRGIEEKRAPEEVDEALKLYELKRQNEALKVNDKTLRTTIDELILRLQKIEHERENYTPIPIVEKLKMRSLDVIGSNIEKIARLFPQCVMEHKDKDGNTVLGIDFEKLRDELSADVIDDGEERYQFTWPDKKAHAHLANTPTTKTLRPCRKESVDFDHTKNLYIEGDNLDVLKVIRETYLGKVKMIYIDPPYNTGNDFVYNDDFAQNTDDYKESSGQFDDEGNRLVQNTESNGRFHTDWLNMIYPRLKVAKDLLTDDGVIFISIDDNEQANLKKVCDEVFGEQNFVAQIAWRRTDNQPNIYIVFHD